MLVHILLLVFVQAAVGRVGKPFYDTRDYGAMGRYFENFLKKHNKMYDETEKLERFGYFLANVKKINEKNGLFDTIYDINHLTDLSEKELKSLNGLKPSSNVNDNGDCQTAGDPSSKDAPAAYDWRDQGAVSPVKNQQACGSCWAFSATAMVESRSMQNKQNLILSEQQLVDCTKTCQGCGGGLMDLALSYLMKAGGQEKESDYPYEADNGDCRFEASKAVVKIKNCTDYTLTSEDALKELLYKEGPISIGIAASHWASYKEGIYEDCKDDEIDHGVLLVGYGTENGEDFWVIKNSWGTSFGENGYIRIKRGVKCCAIGGIGMNAPFPSITTTSIV